MSYIRRGIGDYEGAQAEPYFPFTAIPQAKGDGCGCGGTCGGCGDHGHDHGMGFFTSMDPSTWGVAEWGTVAAAGYFGVKALGSHPAIRKARGRAKSAASKGASSLGSIALWGAAAYAAWWAWNQYQTTGGLGDYQKQGFVNPQILVDPVNSSVIQIPMGWAA